MYLQFSKKNNHGPAERSLKAIYSEVDLGIFWNATNLTLNAGNPTKVIEIIYRGGNFSKLANYIAFNPYSINS